jgi:diacylglycerol kinase (ATP)
VVRAIIRSAVLIVRPGDPRGGKAANRAVKQLNRRGVVVRTVSGNSVDDSKRLLQQAVAEGTDAVVVVGGDGMVAQALPAVAGTNTPLGIIPAGSGNDHARQYGLPLSDTERAADIIADGYTCTVDVGIATTLDGIPTLFGSVLALGFDSFVNARANRMRWPRGESRYKLAALVEITRMNKLYFRLSCGDGRIFEGNMVLVAVGNTQSYGGGMKICPYAKPDDGVLDITIAGSTSKYRVLMLLIRLLQGRHMKQPEVTALRSEQIRIDCPDAPAYADGEYLGLPPVDISVWPAALCLLVPSAPPEYPAGGDR